MNDKHSHTAQSDTLVIMIDNRSPVVPDLYQAPYYALAAAVNLIYCKKHGYDFRYYQTSMNLDNDADVPLSRNLSPLSLDYYLSRTVFLLDLLYMRFRSSRVHDRVRRLYNKHDRRYFHLRDALTRRAPKVERAGKSKVQSNCIHHTLGPRAAAWSKIPCIHHALQGSFKRIVYIDSDAVFCKHDIGLDTFISSAPANEPFIRSNEKSLILCDNWPWPHRAANAGFMVWRNTPRAKEMLNILWNTDAGEYHHKHDAEQAAMNMTFGLLDPNSRYIDDITILESPTFLERKGQYIRHVGNGQHLLRQPRLRQELSRLHIGPAKYQRIIEEIAENAIEHIDTTIDSINQGATGI